MVHRGSHTIGRVTRPQRQGFAVDLLVVLSQFLFRITLGFAGAMALTSPRQVTSGYFRNHLYVTLGFMVLAALVAWSNPTAFWLWPGLAAAIVSYLGAVCWLYEAKGLGRLSLIILAVLAGVGAWQTATWPQSIHQQSSAQMSNLAEWLWCIEPLNSGWLLGVVFAAMLLGHWYLNSPGMVLAPLQRLILLAEIGCLLRGLQWGIAFVSAWNSTGGVPHGWPFWLLHSLAGIIGTLVILVMAWETLKIPNTQSATGILYVGVIFTFLGEVAGMLISRQSQWPL